MKKTKNAILGVIIAAISIVFLLSIGKLGEDVKNNQIIVCQYPFTGNMDFWATPGFRWQWYGKTTEYYKTSQVWFNEHGKEANQERLSYPITYSDKGKGFVLGSVRIELPTDKAHLDRIQSHYGSEYRLVEELIKPTLGKVILSCGPLMTSLESVSEKRTDLIAYATDMLNYGVYATKVKYVDVINTITNEAQKVSMAEIILDTASPNGYKRQEKSPFAYYGIRVSQFSISKLMYENATNNQINKQREADMEIITAKAEAAKAIQKTIQIEEEGKQDAAQSKWKQEAIKAKAVTEAQQAYEVAALQAKEALEVAKRIKAEGEAKAYANQALVRAGLTPLEKATIEKETKIGVAKALSEIKLPTYVVSGGGNGQNNAMDAMGLKMMMDVVNTMTK